MSKILKRLYLGDVVKSFGTKRLRKLTTEEPQDDSIVGTWVFNDVIDLPNINVSINFTCNGYSFKSFSTANENSGYRYLRYSGNINGSYKYYNAYYTKTNLWYFSIDTGSLILSDVSKTIVITDDTFKSYGGTLTTYDMFLSWLKATATKQ